MINLNENTPWKGWKHSKIKLEEINIWENKRKKRKKNTWNNTYWTFSS